MYNLKKHGFGLFTGVHAKRCTQPSEACRIEYDWLFVTKEEGRSQLDSYTPRTPTFKNGVLTAQRNLKFHMGIIDISLN